MTHEDALNIILHHACVRNRPANQPSIFEIDLCCQEVRVKAIPNGDGTYQIEDVELITYDEV